MRDQVEQDNQRYEDLIRGLILPAIDFLAEPEQEDKAFKVLEFIRKECQAEMNLIGSRITWMLAAQALLVSAFVLSLSKAFEDHVVVLWLMSLLICIMGLMITWRTRHALRQANTTIKLWHLRTRLLIEAAQRQAATAKATALIWHAVILGRWSDPDDRIHVESLKLSHVYLPAVFGGFWTIALLVAGWMTYHNDHLGKMAALMGWTH